VWFKIGSQDIGVYSIHLKGILITHGTREANTAKNIRKREAAITQLLVHVHDVIGITLPTIKDIVIGGDFNTNYHQAMFAVERTPRNSWLPGRHLRLHVCEGPDGVAADRRSLERVGSLACDAGF
jgi:hypothetical protein